MNGADETTAAALSQCLCPDTLEAEEEFSAESLSPMVSTIHRDRTTSGSGSSSALLRPTADREKKNDKSARRRAGGSRVSLASLFSRSSRDGLETKTERSRSGRASIGGITGSFTMAGCSPATMQNSFDLSEDSEHKEVGSGSQQEGGGGGKMRECRLCCVRQPTVHFPRLINCSHRNCRSCLMQYVELEITENRVEVSCPECTEWLHPSDIRQLTLHRPTLWTKYERFSLRRHLLSDPDARWCPAPDCSYAVIAAGCAACPQLKCELCNTLFCYHCKGVWHENRTCDEARRSDRSIADSTRRRGDKKYASSAGDEPVKPGDIKACPSCHTLIVKMDDGSCNHMVCAMCGAQFCWLCLQQVSDLHYLSPTGCTFWGKKPWSRKKKLFWQIGTLIGAPVGIALIAGLSVPGIIFGVPVFVGRKVYQRFSYHSRLRRRLLTTVCVVGSLFVSPVLAVMAVGVGVPIMLAYVYGVVPLSLCRNGGCGGGGGSGGAGETSSSQPLGTTTSGADSDVEDILRALGWRPGDRQPLIGGTAEDVVSAGGSGAAVQSTQTGRTRRRGSFESAGVASLTLARAQRTEDEGASTNGLFSGSHCDAKSVYTLCSAHETAVMSSAAAAATTGGLPSSGSGGAVVVPAGDAASMRALAGSVHDAKSLVGVTDCALCALQHKTSATTRPGTPAPRFGQPSTSQQHGGGTRTATVSPPPLSTNTDFEREVELEDEEEDAPVLPVEQEEEERLSMHSDHRRPAHVAAATAARSTTGSQDSSRFRIHSFFDTVKQMVAADAPVADASESYVLTVPNPTTSSSSTHSALLPSTSAFAAGGQATPAGDTHSIVSSPAAVLLSSTPATASSSAPPVPATTANTGRSSNATGRRRWYAPWLRRRHNQS